MSRLSDVRPPVRSPFDSSRTLLSARTLSRDLAFAGMSAWPDLCHCDGGRSVPLVRGVE